MGIAVELVTCNALLDACVVAAGVGPLGEGASAASACIEDAEGILVRPTSVVIILFGLSLVIILVCLVVVVLFGVGC